MGRTAILEKPNSYRWVILVVLTLSQTVMSMGAYAWGSVAPFLRTEFHLSLGELGLFTSAMYLSSVFIAIPSGLFVDRMGARRFLLICLAVMGGSFVLYVLAGGYEVVLILAFVGGIGYGMINQVSVKGISVWFNKKFRATAMGIKQTGVTLGGAISGVMMPFLAFHYGWRVAFLISGLLMLGTFVISLVIYREQPEDGGADERVGQGQAYRQAGLGKGSLRQMFTNPALLILSAISFFMGLSQVSITSFLVLYFKQEVGFSLAMSGITLTVLMVTGAVGRIGWGLISDRLFQGNRRKPMFMLLLLSTISAVGMAWLPRGSSLGTVFLLVGLMGLGFLGWNALMIVMTVEMVGGALAGVATGTMGTMVWVGMLVGSPLFGFVADVAGFAWSWLMLAFFALLSAGLLSLPITKKRRLAMKTF
ncbi:MAG: MFS transporter [Desulfitobacteriaceae bacterium]